jgi:hypothetical protein
MQKNVNIISILTRVAITAVFLPLLLMAPIVPLTAQAAESRQVVGHGTGGDIFCSSEPGGSGRFGTGISNAIIDFSATEQDKMVSGSWKIVIDSSSQIPGSKEGIFTAGMIGSKSYVLKGEETANTLCGDIPVPIAITISGKCGEDVTIKFRSANNVQVATFPGLAFPGLTNVVCT